MEDDDQGKKQVMSEISRACTEWGFVQVVNHGVPPELMDAAMDYTRRFFALSAEEKEVYNVRPQSGSKTGYGRVFEDDERASADWNDGLIVPLYKDHVNRMEGLPKLTNPSGFQEVVDEYGKAVHQLKRKMVALLSEAIGQPSEFFFNKIGGEEAGGHSSFKFYPPCPEPDLVMGISAREDSGSTLSFVQQGDVAGLEVLKDGGWVLVQPIPHAFVVNAGGILQMISNGRFKSVLHRVCSTHVPGGRFSIANFIRPTGDTIVQPAPELCSEIEPPLFKPVKYRYLVAEFWQQALAPGFIKRYELNPIP